MNNNLLSEFCYALTGDSLLQSNICFQNTDMQKIQSIFQSCDFSFSNLEGTVHNFENNVFPAAESGGDWVCMKPQYLNDLRQLGINVLSLSNNHSMDYLHEGILQTIEHAKNSNFVYAGTGTNLFEASKPAYLSTSNTRFAYICFTTTIGQGGNASDQNREMNGRPGVYYIRHSSHHNIPKQHLSSLQEIIEHIVNDNYWDIEVLEKENTTLRIGNHFFSTKPDNYTNYDSTTILNSQDELQLQKLIADTKCQADYVIVSCHTHDHGISETDNTAFQEELAHLCIDAGANCFVAHGPHTIRGIEIYKQSPIFYSIGNFFYQCELIDRQPEDFYHSFSTSSSISSATDVYNSRIASGGTFGELDPAYFQSIISLVHKQDEQTIIELIPLDLQLSSHRSQKGTPQIAEGENADRILSRLSALSKNYGTSIEIKNHRGYIIIN